MILLKYPLPSNNMQASYIPVGLHSEMILLKCIYPSYSNKLTYVYFKSSLVPRLSPAPFSWPHTWPLNRPEKREKARYNFYVIQPQGGLDHDICGLGFSNYGNVPTYVIGRSCEYYWEVHELRNGSGFLVSYCWLLWYHGGPPEASGTDPLVVLLL